MCVGVCVCVGGQGTPPVVTGSQASRQQLQQVFHSAVYSY